MIFAGAACHPAVARAVGQFRAVGCWPEEVVAVVVAAAGARFGARPCATLRVAIPPIRTVPVEARTAGPE